MKQSDLYTESDDFPTKLVAYAGFSFGLIKKLRAASFQSWISGIVVTPRYVKDCLREFRRPSVPPPEHAAFMPDWWVVDPLFEDHDHSSIRRVILDNGAYPAWFNGKELTLSDQIDGLLRGAASLHESLEWVVCPDVVADPAQTLYRIHEGVRALEHLGHKHLLLPVQDGMDIEAIAAMAWEMGAGIFVGGSGWRFKNRALARLADCPTHWVHVGRASHMHQLGTASRHRADSFDSSSFLRGQHYNIASHPLYLEALRSHAHVRRCPVSENHYPDAGRACPAGRFELAS